MDWRDTLGHEIETIPAMNAAPAATDSVLAEVKAILERVGATPADPDDSLLTTVGQRDDSATVAATATLVSLLRNIHAAFNIVAAGAGGGFEIDGSPGLVTALGTTGAVVTDNAASVLGAIGADNADNAFASTSIAANHDGSVLERQESIFQQLYRPLITFDETWQDEAGINTAVWTATNPVTGTAWTRSASGAYLRVYSVPNANETARLVSDQRWFCGPDTYGTSTVLRRLVVEFEMKLTNVANLDNANSFFGLCSADDDTYKEAASYQATFALSADSLIGSTVDNGVATETACSGVTLTNWNKYRIDVYSAGIKFYVNETLKATNVANLPDAPMYLCWYGDTEAGGTATVEIANIRVWTEDVAR